jgi:thioredoxin 1
VFLLRRDGPLDQGSLHWQTRECVLSSLPRDWKGRGRGLERSRDIRLKPVLLLDKNLWCQAYIGAARPDVEIDMTDSPDTPVKVEDSTFDSFLSKYPLILVDCWAPWCGPCRLVGPVIDALAKEYKGKVAFGKLNTDENPGTSGRFDIMAIPTLLVFKNGKPVDQIVGAVPKQRIEDTLKKYM